MTPVTSRQFRFPDFEHWMGPAVVAAFACSIGWVVAAIGYRGAAILVVSAGLIIALWNSPLRRAGHEPLGAVQATPETPAVVVLWRPGCPYSARLRRMLHREGLVVHWVNIWRDSEADALCRRINKGTEETPTVMVMGESSDASPIVIPATVSGIREATSSTAA